MIRSPLMVAAACSLILAPGVARGQETWLVLAASTGAEPTPAERSAIDGATAILAQTDARVLSPEDLQAHLGAEPPPLSDDMRARLEREREELVHLASEGRPEVLSRVEAVFQAAANEIDAIGSDRRAHAHLADLGLFAIRAHLARDDAAGAANAASALLRLLPDAQPTEDFHAAEPLEVLDVARQRRAAGPELRVDVAGSSARCVARVNGVELGEAPGAWPLLPARYRVRVDCGGRPGRIHEVEVDATGGALTVSAAEGRLALDGHARLVFENTALLDAEAPSLAGALAEELGAGHVALALVRDDGVRLQRLERGDEGFVEHGHADLGHPPEPDRIEAALQGGGGSTGGGSDIEWALPVGIGLTGVGLVVGIVPLAVTYAGAGCIDGQPTCTDFREVDDLVWTWVGVGAALAVVGIAITIYGAASQPAAPTVRARFGPTGLSLEGSF